MNCNFYSSKVTLFNLMHEWSFDWWFRFLWCDCYTNNSAKQSFTSCKLKQSHFSWQVSWLLCSLIFMKLVVYIVVVVRRAKYVSLVNLLKKETNWSTICIRQRNSNSRANFHIWSIRWLIALTVALCAANRLPWDCPTTFPTSNLFQRRNSRLDESSLSVPLIPCQTWSSHRRPATESCSQV